MKDFLSHLLRDIPVIPLHKLSKNKILFDVIKRKLIPINSNNNRLKIQLTFAFGGIVTLLSLSLFNPIEP